MTQRKSSLSVAVLLFSSSLAVYSISFFLPTFEIVVKGTPSVSYGYEAFAIGLLSPLLSPLFGGLRVFAPWLANPLFWFGAVSFVTSRCRRACAAGVTAGVTAIVTSTSLWVFNDSESRSLLLLGYYLWVLSIVLLTLAAAMKWMRMSPTLGRRT
jgi:hypothetical protein